MSRHNKMSRHKVNRARLFTTTLIAAGGVISMPIAEARASDGSHSVDIDALRKHWAPAAVADYSLDQAETSAFVDDVTADLGRKPSAAEFGEIVVKTFSPSMGNGMVGLNLAPNQQDLLQPEPDGPNGGVYLDATGCANSKHCVHVTGSGRRVDSWWSTNNGGGAVACNPAMRFTQGGNFYSSAWATGCQTNWVSWANPQAGVFPDGTKLCSENWSPVPPLGGGASCVKIKA